MEKIMTLIALIMLNCIVFAQISTMKVADEKQQKSNELYDSTINFLGKNVNMYIGQELYLKGMAESLRSHGYHHFYLDFKKSKSDKKNIYKPLSSFSSDYNSLAGKYFVVKNVHKDPNARNKFYLELIEKESKDLLFYEYNVNWNRTFPFIVVGYFEKQKEINIGREFIIRGKNWISRDSPMVDIYTGNPVSFDIGSKWKCIDLTIEEKYYTLSLIIENDKGEKIPISVDNTEDTYWVIDTRDAEKYKEKFGEEDWSLILNGEIKIGFTEEMAIISWGKPQKVNKASYGDQWVYNGRNLYFENGILTSYN